MQLDEHKMLKNGNAEPYARSKRRQVPGGGEERAEDTYDHGLFRRALGVKSLTRYELKKLKQKKTCQTQKPGMP